ncbi:MAG: PSD1 and planctomycete cytochrome C domain-containing protein [Pirellulaceae bacterium]
MQKCFANILFFLALLAWLHPWPHLSAVADEAASETTTKETADWDDGEKLFALKVSRLFAEKCGACHGDDPEDLQGGFDMRSRESMLKGGEAFEGDVLIVGDGEKSYLHIVTTREEAGYEMPPKEAERLTSEQMDWIRNWIDLGAKWPSEETIEMIRSRYAEGEIVPTSGGLSDDWTTRRYESKHLWAYRPLDVEAVPDAINPIDWFVNQRLIESDVEPTGDATASELCRRLSFGLTGLPPTADDADLFAKEFASSSKQAVVDYADKLMSSSHYGEHFGRQWLDVARYADSAGFANDYARPNAWRYRDYVIRAFNSDKPYNEFVRQQIAGDEIDASDADSVIATGFLRMGPWEQTSMSVFRVTRQQWLDDVTDSVGQTFLAHPLQCCKCHDHKFDPLPTRDYYSMMAVFSTTQFAEPDMPFRDDENRSGFDGAEQWTKAKIAAYRQQLADLGKKIENKRKSETANAKVGDNGLDPGDEASQSRMNKNIARHKWELDKTLPIALAVYTGKTIARNNVGDRLTMPSNPWGKGYIENDTILTGGDAFSAGAPVQPAPLSAAGTLGEMPEFRFPSGQGKRRLALADWLVHPNNPLTARVMVNRIWAWHFGKGIAGNPNNFGATGRLPTHPELLDYLADWFVKNDWSVKKLNRLILQSETYRRSTRHADPEKLRSVDPRQDLYATFLPRRLTAEELRDSMLACSGELNRQVGGIPCRPDLNLEVAMQPRQIMGGTASVYEPDSLAEQRNRRSVYAEKIRGLRDPFFESFNQPGPDKSCEMRETSTVAPQALTLLNAMEMQDRALAFASSLRKLKLDEKQTIQQAFHIALARSPSKSELQKIRKHWDDATVVEQSKTYKPIVMPSQIKRTVMAEKTGEPYDFIEIMPAYDQYVPDLQMSDVDAKTRSLAHVCLVLMNLNEFAYLD